LLGKECLLDADEAETSRWPQRPCVSSWAMESILVETRDRLDAKKSVPGLRKDRGTGSNEISQRIEPSLPGRTF